MKNLSIISALGLMYLNLFGLGLGIIANNNYFVAWCAVWSFYWLNRFIKLVDEKIEEDKNALH